MQGATQGLLSSPDAPLTGAAYGAGGAVVGQALGNVVGAALKPFVKSQAGTTKALQDVDTQAAQAGADTGGNFSPNELNMAGKVASAVNADSSPQAAQDVASEMASNADSQVPGYQRTAAETTSNPTVQALQQGLNWVFRSIVTDDSGRT